MEIPGGFAQRQFALDPLPRAFLTGGTLVTTGARPADHDGPCVASVRPCRTPLPRRPSTARSPLGGDPPVERRSPTGEGWKIPRFLQVKTCEDSY